MVEKAAPAMYSSRHRMPAHGPSSPWSARCIAVFMLSTLVFTVAAVRSQASELRVMPAITVGEEYNDNVFLHPTDTVSDSITRIIPSVQIVYSAPLWDWDVSYAYEYRYYYRGTIKDDNQQRLNLMSTTRIIKDFFFFDVKDLYNTVSLSTSKDYTVLSPSLGQTMENILTLNPYLMFRPTARTQLTTGYAYRNVWYKDPLAVDKYVNGGNFDLMQEVSARLKMTATVRYEVTNSRLMDFTQTTFLIGPRYEYQDGSVAWCKIGTSKFSRVADEPTLPIWDAALIQRFPTITISYETGRTWLDDPIVVIRREDRYIVSLRRDVERTSLGGSLAYREYGSNGYSDERRYTTSASFSHFLSPKVQGLYSLAIDRYERLPVRSINNWSIVYLTEVRFVYHANESLTYSIDYKYADGYSPDIYLENYSNNRISVEVTKRF